MSTENATDYECELAKKLKDAICHVLLNFGLKYEADNWRLDNNRVYMPLEFSILVQTFPECKIKFRCSLHNDDTYEMFYYIPSAIKWAVENSLNLERKAEVAAQLFFPELFEV